VTVTVGMMKMPMAADRRFEVSIIGARAAAISEVAISRMLFTPPLCRTPIDDVVCS